MISIFRCKCHNFDHLIFRVPLTTILRKLRKPLPLLTVFGNSSTALLICLIVKHVPAKVIRDVAQHLVPTVPDGSKLPIGFLEFLTTEFSKYETHMERIDHIQFYVGITEIML